MMKTAKPKTDYAVEFAKKVDRATGEEVDYKWQFIFFFKKPLSKLACTAEELQILLMNTIGGIDRVKIVGLYSLELTIAHTFDPDEVIEAIVSNLPRLQSEIIQPDNTIVIGC